MYLWVTNENHKSMYLSAAPFWYCHVGRLTSRPPYGFSQPSAGPMSHTRLLSSVGMPTTLQVALSSHGRHRPPAFAASYMRVAFKITLLFPGLGVNTVAGAMRLLRKSWTFAFGNAGCGEKSYST
jgi:hypothetical protein